MKTVHLFVSNLDRIRGTYFFRGLSYSLSTLVLSKLITNLWEIVNYEQTILWQKIVWQDTLFNFCTAYLINHDIETLRLNGFFEKKCNHKLSTCPVFASWTNRICFSNLRSLRNGIHKLSISLMNCLNMLVQVTFLWTGEITNWTHVWSLSFMNCLDVSS